MPECLRSDRVMESVGEGLRSKSKLSGGDVQIVVLGFVGRGNLFGQKEEIILCQPALYCLGGDGLDRERPRAN